MTNRANREVSLQISTCPIRLLGELAERLEELS